MAKPVNDWSTATNETRRLDERKRWAYLIGLTGGVLVLLLSWLFRAPDDPFLQYAYPLFAVLMAGLLPMLWWRIIPLRQFELLAAGLAATVVLSRLGWHFLIASPLDQQLLTLVGGHYWSVAVLVVGVFVILDRKRGLMAAGLVILISALLATGAVIPAAMAGADMAQPALFLVRVHIFLVMLLALTATVATLRYQLTRALIRAEVLDQLANTDMLSGLPNRRVANAMLTREAAEARRGKHPLSVIITDIDRFKRINDTHGHAAGDAVIAGVGEVLQQELRPGELVARWGGEEYLIVAPQTPLESAGRLAEACRRAVGAQPVAGIPVTATFGVAQLEGEETIEKLLARADAMLYRGKADGRNRVVVQNPPSPANLAGDCPLGANY
ncbi:MAG: GGDEF domain-containing protein [Ectothiorhodospiraceae bacterium]|nr:GGDEF domain-containing protein [Ectothiorhodospiraceae bacterium]